MAPSIYWLRTLIVVPILGSILSLAPAWADSPEDSPEARIGVLKASLAKLPFHFELDGDRPARWRGAVRWFA